MTHKKGVVTLNRTLQGIRGNNQLSSGLTVLLAGNFRQTLLVIPQGIRAYEIKACLKYLKLYGLMLKSI